MPSVPLDQVLGLANPLKDWPWCCQAPSAEELKSLLQTAAPEPCPVHTDEPASRHAGRIRFLVENGWPDPIMLDVGIPILGYAGPEWPITDGNHRLAAAALRGDATISVDVSGQVGHAADLLGVPEDLLLDGRSPA